MPFSPRQLRKASTATSETTVVVVPGAVVVVAEMSVAEGASPSPMHPTTSRAVAARMIAR